MEGVLAELSFVLCMCLSVMRAGGGMHLAVTPTLREGRELCFFLQPSARLLMRRQAL